MAERALHPDHRLLVAFVERVPSERIGTGDVITFTDPYNPGRLVTHRVVPLDRRANVDDLDIPEARDWVLRLLGAELARLHYVGHLPMSVAVDADDWEWYRNHPLTKACSERGIIWDKHLPVIMDWLSGRIADGAAMTPDAAEVIRDLRDRLTRADREVTALLVGQPKQERTRLLGKRGGIRLALDYLRGLPS
mgnify:CR=1 FL=1